MTLATLAIGVGMESPETPRLPSPSTSTAACPSAGHASTGEPPGERIYAASVRCRTSGGGRSVAIRNVTAVASGTSTSPPAAPQRRR